MDPRSAMPATPVLAITVAWSMFETRSERTSRTSELSSTIRTVGGGGRSERGMSGHSEGTTWIYVCAGRWRSLHFSRCDRPGAWGSQPLVSTRLRRRAGVRTGGADSQRVEARAYVLEVLADVRTIDRSLRVQEPPEAI